MMWKPLKKEPFIKGLIASRQWYRMSLAVLAMGIVTAFMLVWTRHIDDQMLLRDYPRRNAIMELQVAISKSHLRLKEYLGRDSTTDIEQVLLNLDRAKRLTEVLLNGGEFGAHVHIIQPLTDHSVRAEVESVKSLLAELKTIVFKRYHEGVGSIRGKTHDEIFQGILKKTRSLENTIEEQIAYEKTRSQLIFGIVQIVWLIIVAIAVVGLLTWERRKKQAAKDSEWALITLQKLDQLYEVLLGYGTLAEKLKKITDGVVEIFHADFCRIWIAKVGDFCDSGCVHAASCHIRDCCLHLMASSGRYTHIDGKMHQRIPYGWYKIGKIAAGKQNKFLTNDVTHDSHIHNPAWTEELGLVSFAGYRLLSTDGESLGVLALFAKHAITSKEDAMLEGLADTTAQVIQHERVKEELSSEKERLAVTLRSIGDGVISTNTEGKVLLMNKEAEELTGWSVKDAIGSPLVDIFHIVNEKTRKRCDNPVDKVLKSKGGVGLANHSILIARDGTERILADSGAPIRDKDNKILGVVLVFCDITEKRKMEEDIQRSRKLESVGILAGGIAHDFNNILTAILGNISLAKISLDSANEVHDLLNEAEKATLRARDLTQQLLTFSKGGAPIIKTASIGELIKDSVSFTLRGSKIKCEYRISKNLWPVEIDEGQINQVVNNLIINADQAMSEGGTVRVQCKNIIVKAKDSLPLNEGKYVKISIKDQGHGVTDEHLKKIFDPYFTTKQGGSGLGLTTAYSIIKKHDGHISVEPDKRNGTIFHIYLPASGKVIPIKEDIEEKLLPGKANILVMDDEKIVRDVIINMLGKIGYKITAVSDGKEAVKFYREAKKSGDVFDVVLIDLTIPGGMGGKETIEKLLKIDPEVKAIVSSGYSNDPIMANFKKHGFSGFVAKPYNIQKLNQELRKLIT